MKVIRDIPIAMLVVAALFASSLAAQQQSNTDLVAGINALKAGNYQEALTSLHNAVQTQPNNEAARYYLGAALFHLEQYPEALQAFREAEKLAPKRPGVRLFIGRIYAQQGAPEEAITAYEEELTKLHGPRQAEVLVALGQAFAQAGKLDKAREALAHAIYYDSQYVEALYSYGRVFLLLGEPQEALEQFKKAAEVLQGWNDLKIRLQRLPVTEQRRQQKTEETLAEEYSRAETFAQELGLWPSLNKATGETYMAMGQWANARNAYRRALDRNQLGNPSDPDVYVRVGHALLEDVREMFYDKGLLFSAIPMTKDATEAAEQALEFNPNYAPAHTLLGDVYTLQDKIYASDPERDIVAHTYEDAIEEYKKALSQEPHSIQAMTNMARAYLDKVERLEVDAAEAREALQEASQLIQESLELEPENAELYIQMARMEQLRENYPAALETAEHALDLSPNDVAALNTAGLAAYYLNDLSKATRYFTKAIRRNPDHAQSYTNLGNAFFQMRSWYRARGQYKKALEHTPQALLAKTAYQRAYICYMIGLCYHETEDYDQAIKSLNQALSLDPAYFKAYRQLGRAYLAKHEYRGARRALEIAIQNAPTDQQVAEVKAQIGQVYEAEGDSHAAVAAYSGALELDPNNPVAEAAIARLSQY